MSDEKGAVVLANAAWHARGDVTAATTLQIDPKHHVLTMEPDTARLGSLIDEQRMALMSATEEATRVQRDLAEVASVSSHDLRSGLRGISLLAQWITEDIGTNRSPETKEHLELLAVRVSRMDAILEALLRYLRIGQQQEDAVDVDTAVLLDSIVRKLTRAPEMTVRAEGPMPKLLTQRSLLRQVLVELIENAVAHHDRKDGVITISGRDLGSSIELCVRDDGPGLAEKTQERIFRLFHTGDSTDPVRHVGVGLAVVKRLVESRGGQVTVRALEPRGAAFSFTWPKSLE
ncbi:MAG: ATP-binding protein [Polyangia bacterium]